MNRADSVMESQVRAEIEALHRFFVDWFSGAVPDTDAVFQAGFLRRFDEAFCLIPPAGVLLDGAALADGVRAGHASNPRFRIAIRNVTIRGVLGDSVLATYEEWQRCALASTPPDNARIASVIFRTGATLRWLHVHETWMPGDVVQAGSFDF